MSISVILTCHNEAKFIAQAVHSVTAQTTYDAIGEIIVVNDGSTDNSAAVLTQLQTEIANLQIIEGQGIGVSAARNCALRVSKGDFIAFLDGDDYWVPEKIEMQLPLFQLEKVGLVYSDYFDFSTLDASDSQFIRVRPYQSDNDATLAEYFVHDAPIMPSTAIIRRVVFDDIGFFDEKLRVAEDTDICLRIAERWRFQHVSAALIYKRRHGGNLTHRLDVLLPGAEALTKKFALRNPALASLSGKRMARRYARAGNDCAQHGDMWLATKYLAAAIVSDPLFWRPYLYLILMLIPRRLGHRVRPWLRSIFHGFGEKHTRSSLR